MARKESSALHHSYQSDQDETEDEEVKRNCVMGQSGMRDSDFSESDSDIDETDTGSCNYSEKRISYHSFMEDRMDDLVKFVTIGSPIVKSKGLVVYRPTAIMPRFVSQSEKPNEKDEKTKNVSTTSLIFSNTSVNTSGEFFLPSGVDKETGTFANGSSSSCSCSSEDGNNSGDDESDESDTEIKLTSLDFSFYGGEGLPIEAGVEIVNTAGDIEQECCESSLDGQQEVHETTTGGYALVGASGASVDDKWLTAKQKRVLSSNSLFALSQDRNCKTYYPKKNRVSQQSSRDCSIPEIIIGIEALDQIIQPLPRHYLIKDDYPSLLSGDDEDDMMLSEELKEKYLDNDVGCDSTTNFPIPLLTPPDSPRTVDETFDENEILSVEWPSNLVMDSAIMKALANVLPVSANTERDILLKKTDSTQSPDYDELSKRCSASRFRTISIGTP